MIDSLGHWHAEVGRVHFQGGRRFSTCRRIKNLKVDTNLKSRDIAMTNVCGLVMLQHLHSLLIFLTANLEVRFLERAMLARCQLARPVLSLPSSPSSSM